MREQQDIVVVGFGPAALAIAIAIHDEYELSGFRSVHGHAGRPKVAFVEKQHKFSWHPGMLIEGANMQISFIKDLATPRNPRSRFTFLNYLFVKKRLMEFTNLNTFLPSRIEFTDYLQWCAGHFSHQVRYEEEVLEVKPEFNGCRDVIASFLVRTVNVQTKEETILSAKHVIIAIGGLPYVPKPFVLPTARIVHSSKYMQQVPDLLPVPSKEYKIAVIGSGQSAAEIFNHVHSKYPNSQKHLIMRQPVLRPSDDSPFVNAIFDPSLIKPFYEQSPETRHSIVTSNRNTNYGVVRLPLLERLYETQYLQRIQYGSEDKWPCRIIPNASLGAVTLEPSGSISLEIEWHAASQYSERRREKHVYDLLLMATGYRHNGYESILHPSLRQPEETKHHQIVSRDYRLNLPKLRVSPAAGIWLQGCNEETHGVSTDFMLDKYEALTW